MISNENHFQGSIKPYILCEISKSLKICSELSTIKHKSVAFLNAGGRNRIVSPHNRIVSPHNRIVSPHNSIVSRRNRIVSRRNRIVSGHNRIVSGHNRIVSGHNGIVSGHNGIVSRHNGIACHCKILESARINEMLY